MEYLGTALADFSLNDVTVAQQSTQRKAMPPKLHNHLETALRGSCFTRCFRRRFGWRVRFSFKAVIAKPGDFSLSLFRFLVDHLSDDTRRLIQRGSCLASQHAACRLNFELELTAVMHAAGLEISAQRSNLLLTARGSQGCFGSRASEGPIG
ncbi:hypothetical protein [Aliiroseovarius subalbicans]|uniref:hypothetical protein n=1 Tax=Aliiroseovarius subalbicans TaxID=2925840 RepID=UPI001F5A250F|nr:hypothetical protein [Aliiroseovarius subalbicans]MCI2398530.1 hypothetical protein [Aliiroseovarius subalbicans]